MSTDDTLSELRALSEAATPGDWMFLMTGSEGGSVLPADVKLRGRVARVAERSFEEDQANGRLIAAAVNHVRSLLASQPPSTPREP